MANIPLLSPLETAETISNITTTLPPNIIEGIAGLIMLLKAIGIFFLIYLTILIITTIMNIRRYYMIKKLLNLTEEIHKKIYKKTEKENKKD